jgi:hypothetical protein
MSAKKVSIDNEVLVIRGCKALGIQNVVGATVTQVINTASIAEKDDLSKLPGNSYVVEDFGFTVVNNNIGTQVSFRDGVFMAVGGNSPFGNTSDALNSSVVYKGAILMPAGAGVVTAQTNYFHAPLVSGTFTVAGYFWIMLRRLD